MASDSISPRIAAMAGALALIPVVWYGLASSGTAGLVSGVNVLIILTALAILLGPANGSEQHSTASP